MSENFTLIQEAQRVIKRTMKKYDSKNEASSSKYPKLPDVRLELASRKGQDHKVKLSSGDISVSSKRCFLK